MLDILLRAFQFGGFRFDGEKVGLGLSGSGVVAMEQFITSLEGGPTGRNVTGKSTDLADQFDPLLRSPTDGDGAVGPYGCPVGMPLQDAVARTVDGYQFLLTLVMGKTVPVEGFFAGAVSCGFLPEVEAGSFCRLLPVGVERLQQRGKCICQPLLFLSGLCGFLLVLPKQAVIALQFVQGSVAGFFRFGFCPVERSLFTD